MSVETAILGVSGYAGGELARLLLAHPRLGRHAPLLLGRADAGAVALESLQPQLAPPAGAVRREVVPFRWETLAAAKTKILFLATPHEQSRELAPEALERGLRVIDLSGAWRLKQAANRAVYRLEDKDAAAAARWDEQAVYGLPELHREAIAGARLVANPGCYATSVILALKPLAAAGLLDPHATVISDSKSGVSGAGKAPVAKTHFMYAADNLSAYGVFHHRHNGEMYEQLGMSASNLIFTPHLLPIPRGILSTVYVRFARPQNRETLSRCYARYYASSPMVRLREELPQIQWTAHTGYCDLGFEVSPDGRHAVLVSTLDNLLKGAAGQAVQNMNLMCGWHEEEGLL